MERQFELISLGIAVDQTLLGELSQAGAKGGGADAAESAQLLDRGRLGELSQGLADPFQGGEGVLRRRRGRFDQRESPGRTALSQLQRDLILRSGPAMFGRENQLGGTTAQVEVGVAPAVQFAGAAQGLSGTSGMAIFPGVMDQQDGQLELALELAQVA